MGSATRDDRILRLSTADGTILGEIPTAGEVELVAASSGAVAGLVDGQLVVTDEEGARLASPADPAILAGHGRGLSRRRVG